MHTAVKVALVLLICVVAVVGGMFLRGREERERRVEEGGRMEGGVVDVSFSVRVPENTPGSSVYLVVISFRGDEVERVKMVEARPNEWTTTLTLTEGALIRYFYDRGNPSTKERFDEDVRISFRYLLVSREDPEVEDVVAMWEDVPCVREVATLRGTVTGGGSPLVGATVSVNGFHAATNYDGSFEIEGVPVGKQRITVFTTLGEYKPLSKEIYLTSAGENVNFDLEPAKGVMVTLTVKPPAETPKNAIIKISGNLYQLGSVRWQLNGLTPDPTRWVRMEKLPDGRFTTTLELHEGTYVEYVYTLGLNDEVASQRRVIRSFVVGGVDEVRNEIIESWSLEGEVPVTLNVTIPTNTPPEDEIFIDVGGPILPMDRMSENMWTFTYFTHPGWTWKYRYVRGGVGGVGNEAFQPDNLQAYRSVFIPDNGVVVEDVVERWRWFPRGNYPPVYDFELTHVKPRDFFITGVLFPDYWTPSFFSLFKSSLDRLDANNCDWVALASVWDWGRMSPLPKLQNRSIWSPSVMMPTEDLREVTRLATAKGKRVYLMLTMNDEMTPGIPYWDFHSREWYDGWYREARKFFLYHAKIAEELGVSVLQLHGVTLFQYKDPSLKEVVDNYMRSIITEMRELFSGYLVIDGPPSGYRHYELLDFIGVSVWQDLEVRKDATVDELKAAFDAYFDGEVKEIYETYGKPVVITQFAYPSIDGGANQLPYISAHDEDDPSITLDLEEQARIYEAAFRSIAEREWIVGFIPFGYSYLDLPESKDESIRGKPAENVLAAYYLAFGEVSGELS